MQVQPLALDAYDLVSDPELRRAAAKSLKGFCATYLAHHFPQPPSDFFDEMADALQDHDIKRLEVIGFRGCAKSTMASLALVLWAALEHPNKYPFSSGGWVGLNLHGFQTSVNFFKPTLMEMRYNPDSRKILILRFESKCAGASVLR